MSKDITLLKNNDNKDDLQLIDEFYEFLQGKTPKGFHLEPQPKVDKKTAFSIIYYLQEQFPIFPDTIEQCSKCFKLYDQDISGAICYGCCEHFCGVCEYKLSQCSECGYLFCEKCQAEIFCEDCEMCKKHCQCDKLEETETEGKLEPYEAFEKWLEQNSFQDILDCRPENVNLDRLHEALELYQKS